MIGKAAVVRLDILSQVGWQAATHYGVRGVPTLIVIDGQGQAVDWQYGLPRPGQIVAQVETLLATK